MLSESSSSFKSLADLFHFSVFKNELVVTLTIPHLTPARGNQKVLLHFKVFLLIFLL